jgi:hypothetical protein
VTDEMVLTLLWWKEGQQLIDLSEEDEDEEE